MPLFDYICDVCGERKNDEYVKSFSTIVLCSKDDSPMRRLFPDRVNVDVFPSEGLFLKNVSAEGKTFYSKKEMRRYEKEHNVELGALL